MEKNFIFNLSKNLKYSKDGNFQETASIEFTPPNMDTFDETTEFEQLLMGAMMSASNASNEKPKSKKDEDEDEAMKIPTMSEIRMLIFVSQGVKVKAIAEVFKKIALSSAKLDEKQKMLNSHFNAMEKTDFIDMMCGYASFFTFPSLLRGE